MEEHIRRLQGRLFGALRGTEVVSGSVYANETEAGGRTAGYLHLGRMVSGFCLGDISIAQ